MRRFESVLIAILICAWQMPTFAKQSQEAYDTRWLPITEMEIKKRVRANANDATTLYSLWWRAVYQQQKTAYFKALYDLKQKKPNGEVLGTYCQVLLDSRANYGRPPLAIANKDFALENVRLLLNQAKRKRPRLWINYTAEAEIALYEDTANHAAKRFAFAQRAQHLAPSVSYANNCLGYAYVNVARSNKGYDKKYLNEAIFYYKRAQKLTPTDVGASFLLLHIYNAYAPNVAEARKTRQAILATIPPGTKLNAKCRGILARYKISYKGK